MSNQHYVRQPAFLFFIRIAQILLSVIILGLAANAINVFDHPNDDTEAAFGFALFIVIYTFIIIAYNLGTSSLAVSLWNCWAVLALEIVAVIFWLVSFALLADWAKTYDYFGKNENDIGSSLPGGLGSLPGGSSSDITDSVNDILKNFDLPTNGNKVKRDLDSEFKKVKTAWQCGAAAAGLGAVVWILFVITLVFYALSLHRHRQDPENQNLPADGSPLKDGEGAHEHELKQQTQGYAPQQA